jgi:hypothetical protein
VFYAFCGEIGVRYTADQQALLDLWLRQSRALHWWFPYEGIVLASERHNTLHVDARGRLHAEDRPAVTYPDGWSVYAWRGVRVPERIIMEPQSITRDEIIHERNAELRRIMLERYGTKRLLAESHATVLDSRVQPVSDSLKGWLREREAAWDGMDGACVNELLRLELDDLVIVALNLIDPSTGRRYLIRVPPEMERVQQALAWTHGVEESQYQVAVES